MNADDLKKLTTESLNELAALLEQGRSERLTSLLKTMARFHRYSLHNVCLIVAQRPTATRVAGFHTWRTLGRFVRKGEKGIAILAPIVGTSPRRTRKTIRERSSASAPLTCSTSSKPTAPPCRNRCRSQGDPGERHAGTERSPLPHKRNPA